jgi:hypothetical protein
VDFAEELDGEGIWTGDSYIRDMSTLGIWLDRAGIAAGVAIEPPVE